MPPLTFWSPSGQCFSKTIIVCGTCMLVDRDRIPNLKRNTCYIGPIQS